LLFVLCCCLLLLFSFVPVMVFELLCM
jgi:hypothetical protein